jgi:drug/metabolite transporter (DMT)-like permease
MEKEKFRFKIENLLMLIAAFFWALGHPLGKIIVQKIHPFQLGTVTLTIGFICMILFCISTGRLKKFVRLSGRTFLLSLFIGVLGFFLYQIFTFSALKRIPASMNAILISSNVIFITLLAGLFLKEKIRFLRIVGIIIAAAGVIFVIFNQGFALDSSISIIGCMFSIGAAIVFSLYTISAKRILEENDPVVIVTIALFSGALLLAILTSLTVGLGPLLQAGSRLWILMGILGVGMIGISYPIWFTCLKRLPASHISLYIYMVPVFAVILSLAILGERFQWLFWLGAILVLGGIVTANVFTSRGRTQIKN